MALKVPTIHLNGTSKKDLLDGYKAAYLAVGEALDKLQQTVPHGRDYYVQGSASSIQEAIAEHVVRWTKLDDVRKELLEIAIAIQDQGKDRS
jgi:aspartate/methionine/tyrosine aminotransferase